MTTRRRESRTDGCAEVAESDDDDEANKRQERGDAQNGTGGDDDEMKQEEVRPSAPGSIQGGTADDESELSELEDMEEEEVEQGDDNEGEEEEKLPVIKSMFPGLTPTISRASADGETSDKIPKSEAQSPTSRVESDGFEDEIEVLPADEAEVEADKIEID